MADASYPDDLLYHPEHDWARIDGDEAVVGITWYAADAHECAVGPRLPAHVSSAGAQAWSLSTPDRAPRRTWSRAGVSRGRE